MVVKMPISIFIGLLDMWLVLLNLILQVQKALAQMILTVQNLTQSLRHSKFHLIFN